MVEVKVGLGLAPEPVPDRAKASVKAQDLDPVAAWAPGQELGQG